MRRPSLSRLGTCVHDLVPGPSGTLVGCGCGHLCPAQHGGGERYHSGHWAPGTQDLEVRPCPARLPRRLGRLTGLCAERRPLSVMAPGREDRLPRQACGGEGRAACRSSPPRGGPALQPRSSEVHPSPTCSPFSFLVGLELQSEVCGLHPPPCFPETAPNQTPGSPPPAHLSQGPVYAPPPG